LRRCGSVNDGVALGLSGGAATRGLGEKLGKAEAAEGKREEVVAAKKGAVLGVRSIGQRNSALPGVVAA
jgi:hypothetical protein